MLQRIPRYENFRNSVDFEPGAESLYIGNVASGTQTSLTDTEANWSVNEWKDKVVKIKRNGGTDFEFGVIESNTPDQLIFDDSLIFVPCNLCVYEILNTLIVEPHHLPITIAVILSGSSCGILLPKSTKQIERQSFHSYIEKSLNGNYTCVIMSRGIDRQFGAKYGTLEHQSEGVNLYAHQLFTPHWDIIQTYNIKRLAAAYFSQSELVTTANNVWDVIGNENTLIYDNKKRFVEKERDGKIWIRYTSLLSRDFRVTVDTTVQKTGGGQGEFYLSVAKRDGVTGIVTYFYDQNRLTGTKFGGTDGVESITVKVPVFLKRNDEVAIVAMKTASTMTISVGSIDLIEF
jgi:hypothetical protein